MKSILMIMTLVFIFSFDSGVWAQKATPTPDIQKIIPFLPKVTENLRVIQMVKKDATGDGIPEGLWVVQMDSDNPGIGTSMSYLLILGKNGKLLWVKAIDGYGSPLVFGKIHKNLPVCFGYYDWMATSAGSGPWHFYLWKSLGPDNSKKNFYPVTPDPLYSGGTPTFQDINGDGFNDLVFDNAEARYQPPDQIFIWDNQEKVFKENSSFPTYWQPQIEHYLLKLENVSGENRDSFYYIQHLAKLFKLRGGKKGLKEFQKLARLKMEPFLNDRRNDYLQTNAQYTLKEMEKILDEKSQ